jgi:transposase
MMKRKGITRSDASGDGTGYSVTAKQNYESHAHNLKDRAKQNTELREDQKESRGHKK